jgi:hypothetical protein
MRKKSVRGRANDRSSRGPTNTELAHQVTTLRNDPEVHKQLAIQFQRIAAIQAQLDHLPAKRGNNS